jgi:hypothetical protein
MNLYIYIDLGYGCSIAVFCSIPATRFHMASHSHRTILLGVRKCNGERIPEFVLPFEDSRIFDLLIRRRYLLVAAFQGTL